MGKEAYAERLRKVQLTEAKTWVVRRAAAKVLRTCGAEERQPHIARVVEMLSDEDEDVCRAAVGVLQACSVGERGGRETYLF